MANPFPFTEPLSKNSPQQKGGERPLPGRPDAPPDPIPLPARQPAALIADDDIGLVERPLPAPPIENAHAARPLAGRFDAHVVTRGQVPRVRVGRYRDRVPDAERVMQTDGRGAAAVAVVEGFHGVEGRVQEGGDPVCERAAARREGLRCDGEGVAAEGVVRGYVEGEEDQV